MRAEHEEPYGLYDGDDVDTGEEAPEADDYPPDELAAIRASQRDPGTAGPDAEAS
ncbi:hypothetical protein ACFFWC_28365 [Plantactinospora siamensis]|uniref:DUF5709 domain-containing protein n=1 Tax=Plantactinospora siamensis TaxID=555372 RepID=A0ABV6NV89_9ACTN